MDRQHTRIAPSPTGPIHLGTVRTAYFNWIAARATGGRFLVRIDDTDKKRSDQKYADQFFDILDWLGLDYDATFNQSDRINRYLDVAKFLVDKELAAWNEGCCRLDLKTSDYANKWDDDIAGSIPILDDNMRGFSKEVLIKSDGMPTYHFASVVDDIDSYTSLVIRGVDHQTNTARQVALFNIIGFKVPRFCHIGLLHQNGKKLSKRDSGSCIMDYKDQGIDPDAMLNFLARLGWGPIKDDKSTAILTKDDMVKMFFSGGKMKNSKANVDLVKLASFDRKYKARKKQGILQ